MSNPNIVFIMTDQLRADCLGYAGHPDVKTPYLDTLAARELSLTGHTVPAPAVSLPAPHCTPAGSKVITAG